MNNIEKKEITILYEISLALSSSLDISSTIDNIFEILHAEMGMRRGTLSLLNQQTGKISIELAHGITDEARKRGIYKIGEGITGKVIEKGEPAIIENVGDEPRFLNRTRSRGDIGRNDISFICVPIGGADDKIGALSVDRLYSNDISLEEDVRILTIIASMIAQSIKFKRMVEAEKNQLITENLKLRTELIEKFNLNNFIGNSNAMHEVFEQIVQVADSNATVLIRGESGTGKELVAHAIHYNSPRASKPFVKINCGAIPENLIESELFGHEKGSFTGAVFQKKGKFELAEGGTIFLDEIGELSPILQVKLLRVLQEKEYERVGGIEVLSSNVRVIAATNRDLEKEMEKFNFREDLYYRLNVFSVFIPPLRERRTDVLLLAEHFLHKYSNENKKDINRISTLAIDLLNSYHWPGNVRELENCMERSVLVCNGDTIQAPHLPPSLQRIDTGTTTTGLSLASQVESFEKEIIIDALKKTKGNKAKSAKYLDTSERIMGYKISKYNIDYRLFRR